MNEVYLFICQFTMVYLLGLQSRAVNSKQYLLAAAVSLALGIVGYYLQATLGKLPVDGWFTAPWFAYIIAGPVAICGAMWTHSKLVSLMNL